MLTVSLHGAGGHGNALAVKRALELDMGVFLISPVDKGGHLYMPSKSLARTIGPNMSPMEFAMLSHPDTELILYTFIYV